MSPPMTRWAAAAPQGQSYVQQAGPLVGPAGLWLLPGQAEGRPRVTDPVDMEPGAVTNRGTRRRLAEA